MAHFAALCSHWLKRRLLEYLAVVRLRALIAQDTEVEQAKA
jgi:hypothetical protein